MQNDSKILSECGRIRDMANVSIMYYEPTTVCILITKLEITAGHWAIFWPNTYPSCPGIPHIGQTLCLDKKYSRLLACGTCMCTTLSVRTLAPFNHLLSLLDTVTSKTHFQKCPAKIHYIFLPNSQPYFQLCYNELYFLLGLSWSVQAYDIISRAPSNASIVPADSI